MQTICIGISGDNRFKGNASLVIAIIRSEAEPDGKRKEANIGNNVV